MFDSLNSRLLEQRGRGDKDGDSERDFGVLVFVCADVSRCVKVQSPQGVRERFCECTRLGKVMATGRSQSTGLLCCVSGPGVGRHARER